LGCCGYDFEHSERRLGVSIGKSPGYLVVIHDSSLSFDLVPLDPRALTRDGETFEASNRILPLFYVVLNGDR